VTSAPLADGQQPRALPIRPRPQAGETPASYIRRLARANHLRTAYLNRYLRDPGQPGQVRLDWLAALAARPVTSLERAFTGTPQRHRPRPDRRRNSKADLAAIRQDAEQGGRSVRALADQYGVHRRTVHQALASPVPAPRKPPTGRTSKLDPVKDAISAVLQQEMDSPDQPARTVREIFDWLVTEHGATKISYSTVRDYVAAREEPAAKAAANPGTCCQAISLADFRQPAPQEHSDGNVAGPPRR
jgi:transposase